MNKSIKITILFVLVLIALSSCRTITNQTKYHRFVELGQTEQQFKSSLPEDDKVYAIKVPIKDKAISDKYVVYLGANPTVALGESYIYLFKDNKLEYYNQVYRFTIHENEEYRNIARYISENAQEIEESMDK